MKHYLITFILLFAIETAIVVFPVPHFVRGFVGDVLVIPLLYVLLRSLSNLSGKRALLLVLVIALVIELLQLFPVAESLNIQNKLVLLILGDTFDGWDLVAYLFGVLPVLFIEKIIKHGTS